MYTESMFTLLFLHGYFYTQKNKMLKASSFFGLSSLVRSNSVFFLLFLKPIYFPIIIGPIAAFQMYSFILISKVRCSFKPFIPYSYVQKEYWNHGFLKFLLQITFRMYLLDFQLFFSHLNYRHYFYKYISVS